MAAVSTLVAPDSGGIRTVATGLASLDQLEEAFCRPKPGSQLDPHEGSTEIYARLRERFAQALPEAFPTK